MELCEDALNLITFGDVVAFIKHLMKSHPDIVDNSLDGTPTYALHLNERLKTQPVPVIVSPDDCGELLAGGHCLSERAYKTLGEFSKARMCTSPRMMLRWHA